MTCAAAAWLGACATPLPDGAARPPVPAWNSSAPVDGSPTRIGQAESLTEYPGDPPRPYPASGLWTLEDCVNRALSASRGILDAEVATLSADYSIAAAQSAFELRLFPAASASTTSGPGQNDVITAGFDLVKRTRTGATVNLSPSVSRSSGEYAGGYVAGITQPLLRGRQREFVENALDGSRYFARATRRSLYLSQVNTTLSTVSGVMAVVRLRESLRLNEESAERSLGHVRAARARERAGLASSLDVVRANQQATRAADGLNTARQAYGDALDSLRLLLALPLDVPLVVEAPLIVEDIHIGPEEALRLAIANRVELLQAQDDLDEALRRSRVAAIDTQPDLDLNLSVAQFGSGSTLGDGLELDGPSLTVGLGSTSDLWRTAERARLAQTRLSAQVVRRRQELTRDQVVRDVRGALRDLERDTERIALQETQVDQATGKLRAARIKFERGIATNFDVIEAEEELRSAEISLITAVAATIVDGYALRAALGTLVERPTDL